MSFFKNIFFKSCTDTLIVTSSSGFHLRPVAQFVSKAKSFTANIEATFNDKTVSAKAVNALLSLNLDKQDTFTLTAKGKDATMALQELKKLFTSLMQNDKEIKEVTKEIHSYQGRHLKGDGIVAGIAIAKLHPHAEKEVYTKTHTTFKSAVNQSLLALEKSTTQQNQDISSISLAQRELLLQLYQQSATLEDLTSLIEKEIASLKGGKLESKGLDYQDILRLVKSHLGYSHNLAFPAHPFILLADDLLPSDIARLEKSAAVGVILKKTSPTSHTAILLRTAGITSLILPNDITSIPSHDVILDTYAGLLIVNPNTQDLNQATSKQSRQNKKAQIAHGNRFDSVMTKDNKHINIYANITDIHSAKDAKEQGADGIGLLRTEFLFGEQKPTLEIQKKAYAEIFSLFKDVTIRTLDVGGDKALPYITLPKEDNPFLGIRGVRLLITHPEIMREQLHAIFLAANNKKIKIMFPMISSVEEFVSAKEFALEIAKSHHLPIDNILFGIMLEVPSVLFLMDKFNEVVDFYSIGTNDLSQYLFAIERTHPTLKVDTLSPVLFSAIETIVAKATKPVSICGELAANTDAIQKLIDIGIETLSVSAKSIAQTKQSIRNS